MVAYIRLEWKCYKIILCSLVMLVAYSHLFLLVVLGAWPGTLRGCQLVNSQFDITEALDTLFSIFTALINYWEWVIPQNCCYLEQVFPCFNVMIKLLTLHLSLLAKSGIHEAITGNFLDSYNLSLLNPYMVCVFCNWFSSFSSIIIFMNICSMQPNLSASWLFQRAMSAKQQSNVSPDFISELLYANFQSMQVSSQSAPLTYTFLSSLMSLCVTSPEARRSGS